MIFQFKDHQIKSLLRQITIIYCLLIFIFLFPATGKTFDKKLTKKSKGESFPYTLKSDNFSLNARNVKILKSHENFLWIGTSMGVIKYDTTTIDDYVIYDNRNFLLSNGIFSITIDKIKTYGSVLMEEGSVS